MRILKGRPAKLVPDPGMGAHAATFSSGGCTYRVRTVPFGRDKKGKVIFLESHPPGQKLNSRLAGFELSTRQEEISILVVQGLSNREIAERLFITEQTVKDHLRHVFEKMKINRRSEIGAKVMEVPLKPPSHQ